MVAHNLIPDTPTPKVHYEDVYISAMRPSGS
jgi:hypothetical protein